MLKSVLSNKIVIYLVSRYGTYALQFIVSIAIASKLGPYYFGIYGFITLILNYFSQINLGIPHSLNVLLVHNKDNEERCKNYIGNSFAIYGLVSLFIIGLFLCIILFDVQIDCKYPMSVFMLFLICLISIMQYFAALCSTILRIKNKVNQLAIAQSSLVLLNLLAFFIFDGKLLIYALMICQIISLCIFVIISLKENLIPNFKLVKYDLTLQRNIIKKGFFLFIYNSCFYFILISVRSIISGNYSIEEFGIFNFSYTLAHAILLLIESLTTIMFPKIIFLLSSKDYRKINATLENIRVSFVSTSHLLIYIALIFFPVVIIIIPKFDGALSSMNLIALAILMNTNSYGYSSFLVAQNKEKISALISFISLVINIIVAKLLVDVFNVGFSHVIISVMVTYFCYSLMNCVLSHKIMGTLTWNSIKDFFPLRLFLPYTIALIISFVNLQNLIALPLLLFICLNFKDIKTILLFGKKMIQNPNIADI